MNQIKEKLGLLFFVGALFIYILVKLPSDASVLCSNGNEGFYFVYGEHLLHGKHLYTDILTVRGPLFILFYSIILGIFNFTTYSIIAVHLFHTLMIFFICVAIYLLINTIIQNSVYSGLGVCLWVLLQITPIGLWGNKFELEATFALEAEYFCVLFSLYSILSLLFAFKSKLGNKNCLILSFLSGFLAALSTMFKASGAVLAIAVICWVVYLFFFEKKTFYVQKNNIVLFCVGLFVSLLVFIVSLYIYNGELISFWQSYFMFGNYSKEPLSLWLLVLRIKRFMFRYVPSLSNFILFFISFLLFAWGLIRSCVIKKTDNLLNLFFPLISIWGIGNVCAIIAAGDYGSYYYVLIWPSISIVLSLGLYDAFGNTEALNRITIKIIVVFLIFLFAFHRLQILFPTYLSMTKEKLSANIFRQPQSFQDPISPYDLTHRARATALTVSDKINSYLPNKKDSLYIFAFVPGHQFFGPPVYIYAKRLPVSPIISDWLHYEKACSASLTILRKQLFSNLPKILIFPEKLHLEKWQMEALMPFFNELGQAIRQNYHLRDTFSIELDSKEKDAYLVFERN